ncbi:MAG TPA: ERF family protein [Kofleriaceae bacterium]
MSAVPAVREQHALATADSSALMKIIERASTDKDFDVAKLEKLLEVKERWEAAEAKKAFVAAMAAFKAEPTTILKQKAVNIPGGAQFNHATLAAVVDGVVANLSKHGFSHRWEVIQQDKLIIVSCILTHELGHQERTTLSGAPDDSGKKNAIQQIGSTVTYLQRYTLMAATGLAAKDMDNDGGGAGRGNGGQMDEKALADHLANIDAAVDREGLMKAFGTAWNAAQDMKDKGAQRLLNEHKQARLKALGAR